MRIQLLLSLAVQGDPAAELVLEKVRAARFPDEARARAVKEISGT